MDVPFSESQYRTDKTYIRGTGMGQNADANIAMSIALNKAQEDLGGQIETVVKQQFLELSQTNSGKTQSTLEQNSKTIVHQALNHYEILEKKTIKLKDGNSQIWVVLQMARTEIQKAMNAPAK